MPTSISRARLATLVFVLCVLLVAPSARAEKELPTTQPNMVSVLSFVGYSGSSAVGDPPNIYGVGVGIRAGWTSTTGIYFGGMLFEHAGYSLDPATPASRFVSVRGARTAVGGELGYEWVGPIVLRPYMGVGALLDRGADRDSTGKYITLSRTADVGIWPGVMALLPIQRIIMVGLDTHITVPGVSDGAVGLELYLVIGTRFSLSVSM